MGRRSRAVPTAPREEVEFSSSESSDESLYEDVVGDYEIDPSVVGEPSRTAGIRNCTANDIRTIQMILLSSW